MVKAGVERLTEMQCSDGGWGWFSGWGEYSSPHTTAQVVHGLWLAKQNDVALVPGVLGTRRRVAQTLPGRAGPMDQERRRSRTSRTTCGGKQYADNLDAFVYMVLVDAGEKNADMLEFLYRDRTHLAVYGMAMYGIALEKQGEQEKLAMILRNIGQYVEQDDENQTAWLRMPENSWWYWYGSEYEAEAYYLELLARTDPKGELASRLVKYLLNNRRNATYWNSTRDTALCVEAFAEFIRRSGEDRPEMTVEVYYDGKLQKAVEITPQTLFTFDNKFVLGRRRRDGRPAHRRAEEEGHRPALLQRLPDHLHPRRFHQAGRAGGEGRSQVLQAGEGPQVDPCGRLARAGGRARRSRSTSAKSCRTSRKSRAATWWKSNWKSRARTTTSIWSSRT